MPTINPRDFDKFQRVRLEALGLEFTALNPTEFRALNPTELCSQGFEALRVHDPYTYIYIYIYIYVCIYLYVPIIYIYNLYKYICMYVV